MRRDVAEKIVAVLKQHDELLNELSILSKEIDDEGERKKVRRALGELILHTHEKITLKIVEQYPDLHPDKNS